MAGVGTGATLAAVDAAAWAAYEAELAAPPAPGASLFVPLDEQLDNVRRWNAMRRWGLTAGELAAVDLTPYPLGGPLVVDLVVAYLDGRGDLDGVRRTADEWWLLAADQQPNAWCWDDWYWNQPDSGPKPVRLLPGLQHRPGAPGPRRPRRALAAGPVRPPAVADQHALRARRGARRGRPLPPLGAGDGRAQGPVRLADRVPVTLPRHSRHHRLPCLARTSTPLTMTLTSHDGRPRAAVRLGSPRCRPGSGLTTAPRPAPLRPQ